MGWVVCCDAFVACLFGRVGCPGRLLLFAAWWRPSPYQGQPVVSHLLCESQTRHPGRWISFRGRWLTWRYTFHHSGRSDFSRTRVRNIPTNGKGCVLVTPVFGPSESSSVEHVPILPKLSFWVRDPTWDFHGLAEPTTSLVRTCTSPPAATAAS